MKILLIGGGGREHALALKMLDSPLLEKLYVLPGNGGTASIATNVAIDPNNMDAICEFADRNQIDLTVVGPEASLAMGIVDKFHARNLKIVGPHYEAAQLESSKDFSKRFMERHKIPSARHITVKSVDEGIKALEDFSYPVVIKADGLCFGKGVVIAEDETMAKHTLHQFLNEQVFGDQGKQVVIESFLDGFEVSQICLVQKDKLIPFESSQDYKRIGENNTGENTGGVGCLSPSPLIDPVIFEPIYRKIEKGLKEDNLEFYGVLFIGFMIVDDVPYVLEFNARFGDPETQVLMPRLKNDLVKVFVDLLEDNEINLSWDDKKTLALVLTSQGYPGSYKTGFPITIKANNAYIYHNGTVMKDSQFFTSGGRVLTLVTQGDCYKSMNESLLSIVDTIDFEGKTYRRDIGLDIK